MEQLQPAPRGYHCRCGATLWYIRAAAPGQRSYLLCKRQGCDRRYSPRSDNWTPTVEVLKTIFRGIEQLYEEEERAKGR